jgi:hypothetical protein
VIKRALLFLLVMGCVVSAAASGRISARLILDGAISFAFVPIFQIAAFALVYRFRTSTQRRAPTANSFARASEQFLAGDVPWLLWLVAVAAFLGIRPPRVSAGWFLTIVATAIVPAILVARLDFRFFRHGLGATSREAARSVIAHRAIAWTLAITYFFGIALWSEQLPELAKALGL